MAKDMAESLCQKAQQAIAKGDNALARQLFQQAMGVRPDNPDVHYGLATACFLVGDLPTAAYHFREVTRLDPLRAGAYINLGAVYNRLDQLDDAIPMLRRGIQLDMNRAEGYYNLGLVHRRQNQLDLAIQAYREAVRINPRMADAHFNIGNIYLEQGKYSLATAHYKQALELRPNWEKARRGLEQATGANVLLGDTPAETESSATKTTAKRDPDRPVDPNLHASILTILHRNTIETVNLGQNLLTMLEKEIEPVIKELSTCMLIPDRATVQVGDCLRRFDEALVSLKSVQTNLTIKTDHVRESGEQLINT